MELTVGAIVEGKVKTITNFGAFVTLPENKTGMVHISEVANSFVSDIRQHLTEGQDVKVMVIGTDNGKINLSKLVIALANLGCEIITSHEQDESLENYFMNLIGGDRHD